MSKTEQQWSKKEESLLLDYMFNDDSENVKGRIEFAMYKLYEEESPPNYKKRSYTEVYKKYRELTIITNPLHS